MFLWCGLKEITALFLIYTISKVKGKIYLGLFVDSEWLKTLLYDICTPQNKPKYLLEILGINRDLFSEMYALLRGFLLFVKFYSHLLFCVLDVGTYQNIKYSFPPETGTTIDWKILLSDWNLVFWATNPPEIFKFPTNVLTSKKFLSRAWWCITLIPGLGKQR